MCLYPIGVLSPLSCRKDALTGFWGAAQDPGRWREQSEAPTVPRGAEPPHPLSAYMGGELMSPKS